MKTLLATLLGFCFATSLPAQGPADNPPAPKRSPEELAELLGPIALYPDALIALILPASTYPSDIVLGARFVTTGGNPANVEDKSWDSSVKALTRYPDTLKWLDENLEWTAQVGDAFIEQPVEVMEAIQQLRARARELGNLVDTPQQRIVQEDRYIRIVPAQPDYIFEPRYDPEVIFYERPVAGPLLFFGLGFGVGSWLNYDWDWHRHRLYRGEWHGGWDYSRDRIRRDQADYIYINNNLTNSREWRPDPVRHHTQSRRVLSERTTTSASSLSRTQSREPAPGEPRRHHPGIAQPKLKVDAPRGSETVRRAEQRDGGKVGIQTPAETEPKKKSGDVSKGHVASPRTAAPGLTEEKKRGRDSLEARDNKKPDNEPAGVNRRADAPPKKEAEAKAHVDMPPSKRGSSISEESKHKEVPKREVTPKVEQQPKRIDNPKREEPKKYEGSAKRSEAPKHEATPKVEEPRRVDTPKHEEPKKRQDVTKRPEVKQEPPKPQVERAPVGPSNEKGKKGDKKNEDDKKKKE